MRHTFLIEAHNQPDLLKILLEQLDDNDNDIVLHLDAKSSLTYEGFSDINRHATFVPCNRIKVAWGGYSEVKCELLLLQTAVALGHHDYYHLLSGSDLPLRSIQEINAFFAACGEKEFINFENPARYPAQYVNRLKYRHFFRDQCGKDKNIFTALNKAAWLGQRFLRMPNKDTIPEREFVFGSQWFDITEDLAADVLSHAQNIEHQYRNTSCADEVFLQHLVWNGKWRPRLWRPTLGNGMEGNMRYINWGEGISSSPRTIDDGLVSDALSSGMLFARKFDYENYPSAVKKVLEAV